MTNEVNPNSEADPEKKPDPNSGKNADPSAGQNADPSAGQNVDPSAEQKQDPNAGQKQGQNADPAAEQKQDPNAEQKQEPGVSGRRTQGNEAFLSWQILFVNILLFGLAAVLLSKPVGSISGRIAMEQEGFDLYSYNMREHKVYATAIGPRGGVEDERGVWVDKDGRFVISQLPVGEYQLKVRVPGFSTTYESGNFVKEGECTELVDPIQLQIAEPTVSMGTNCRVFTTKEKPSFWANAQGTTKLVCKLYKKDMLELLGSQDEKKMGVEVSSDLSLYKPYGNEYKVEDVFQKLKPVKSWTRIPRVDAEDSSHENFKCDEPLAPGDYFAVVEASNVREKTDRSIIWFTVTDIGIIVKQDFNKTVVRAIDLVSLKPVSGVSIQVRDRGASSSSEESGEGAVSATKVQKTRLLSKGNATTGADGFAELGIGNSLAGGCNTNLIVCGFKGEQHAYGGMSMYRNAGDQHQTYFYTDRPIYRLGQTVYFRGICRDLEGNGFKNPGEIKLDLSLEDPDNSSIWSGKVKTSKFGTFHGTLEIPKEGKTGAYQINITYPDGSNEYQRIEIDEYRKPEYKVDVLPLEARELLVKKQRLESKRCITLVHRSPTLRLSTASTHRTIGITDIELKNVRNIAAILTIGTQAVTTTTVVILLRKAQ